MKYIKFTQMIQNALICFLLTLISCENKEQDDHNIKNVFTGKGYLLISDRSEDGQHPVVFFPTEHIDTSDIYKSISQAKIGLSFSMGLDQINELGINKKYSLDPSLDLIHSNPSYIMPVKISYKVDYLEKSHLPIVFKYKEVTISAVITHAPMNINIIDVQKSYQ
ncbi:hypothetical protein [Hymenobacter sp. DG25B]|uniref:hypothetical protein n=1 Tax=Hymenobacter sp. DG25B TaxID=1385664 RepID=UPI0012E02739|nr:hypothetical protein [Hymenobacter sp. DG25B]